MTTPAWAANVCAGVHAAGSRDVVYVPDNPLSQLLREFEARYRDIRLVLAAREGEAFGIAAGLYLGGRLPTVMLQSSGLGNSLNAVSSLLVPYQIADELRRAIADTAGPRVVIAKVTESAPVAKPPLDCVFIKQRFMAAIHHPEPATAGQPLPQPPP